MLRPSVPAITTLLVGTLLSSVLGGPVGVGPLDADSADGARRVAHTGEIREHTTWTADVVHELRGTVRVMDGATLEIEPGARIEALAASSIIIERTSRIRAIGTEAVPIILTCGDGVPAQGCWLGVIVAGNAPVVGGTNTSPPVRGTGPSGCAELPGDGFHGAFGGCDAEDDSGELRFVRIEYASRGLELLGVGRGTRVSSVQVHDALATAVTVRGGTVDLRRVIASSFGGTALRWADGWRGRAQHFVAHRLQGSDSPAIDGTSIGQSGPALWQTTIVGDGSSAALRLVGGAPVTFRNAIIVGSASAIDLDGAAACEAAASGSHVIADLALVGVGQEADPDPDAECAAHPDADWTLLAQPSAALRSAPIAAVSEVLRSALTAFLPDLRPLGVGNALDLTGVMPPADGFFEAVDRLGGVEPNFGLAAQHGIIPWYSGWTTEGAAPAALLGAVTGTVRTGAGVPVGDVRVRVSSADQSARSAGDGSYTVSLARPGAAVVTAELLPDGCVAAPVHVLVAAGAVASADVVLTCGASGFDPAGIRLTYICGNTFRVKNPHPVAVPVTCDRYGTMETGSLLLPPANAAAPSTTFFTVATPGTVRLFYSGAQIDVKANGDFDCAP